MTGLDWGLLLLIVLTVALAASDGRHWDGERRKTEMRTPERGTRTKERK